MSFIDKNKEIENYIAKISSLLEENKNNYLDSLENKAELMRAFFSVKVNLERILKNPKDWHKSLFECVDTCRKFTPYYSADLGKNKIDSPLTEEEKNKFIEKLNGVPV